MGGLFQPWNVASQIWKAAVIPLGDNRLVVPIVDFSGIMHHPSLLMLSKMSIDYGYSLIRFGNKLLNN